MPALDKKVSGFNSFKALFISDPESSETDSIAISPARGDMNYRVLFDEVLEYE
jgi:hypothetical protein